MARKNNNQSARTAVAQTALPIVPTAEKRLDVSALETWLWDAAWAIRGATDALKIERKKRYIFPLQPLWMQSGSKEGEGLI